MSKDCPICGDRFGTGCPICDDEGSLDEYIGGMHARIAQLASALSEQAEAVRVLAETNRKVATMLQIAYDNASLTDVANSGWCTAALLHAIQDLQAAVEAARKKGQ